MAPGKKVELTFFSSALFIRVTFSDAAVKLLDCMHYFYINYYTYF